MLTDRKIAKLSWKPKRFHLLDREGLRLAVFPEGRWAWQLRATIRGKPAVVTLGYWPQMRARGARQKAAELRGEIAEGRDPRNPYAAKGGRSVTVEAFAKRWVKDIVSKWRKNPLPIEQRLARDVIPRIGQMPLAAVTMLNISRLVYDKRDEQGRPAAAIAVRDTLLRMFEYARVLGLIEINPVKPIERKFIARLRSRTRALSESELKLFYLGRNSRLGWRNATALELLLLTLARKSELMQARWKHIDLDKGVWEVPPELSKSGRPHIVYISRQALNLFKALWPLDAEGPGGQPHPGARRLDPEEYIFQHQSSRTQPMAPNVLNKAINRVDWGMPHFTPHDLRRTASTILNEQGYSPDVIEKALNHAVRGGVRGIYNRAQYAAERKRMLQEWADYLEGLK